MGGKATSADGSVPESNRAGRAPQSYRRRSKIPEASPRHG